MPPSGSDGLVDLPSDLVRAIAVFLDPAELGTLCAVCKTLQSIAEDYAVAHFCSSHQRSSGWKHLGAHAPPKLLSALLDASLPEKPEKPDLQDALVAAAGRVDLHGPAVLRVLRARGANARANMCQSLKVAASLDLTNSCAVLVDEGHLLTRASPACGLIPAAEVGCAAAFALLLARAPMGCWEARNAFSAALRKRHACVVDAAVKLLSAGPCLEWMLDAASGAGDVWLVARLLSAPCQLDNSSGVIPDETQADARGHPSFGRSGKGEGQSSAVGRILLLCRTQPWRGPMLPAIVQGHVEVVRLLIRKGAVPHQQYLVVAVGGGNLEMVRLLTPFIAEESAGLAAIRAATAGNMDILRLLAEHGAPLNEQDGQALKGAAFNGHLEVVRMLLDHGPHLVDHREALLAASFKGRSEVIRLLLERGAVPLPEHAAMAKEQGHLELARWLDHRLCGPPRSAS